MISVKEAKQKIEEKVGLLQPKVLPLEKVSGLVLAENVYAKFDIPAFEQSSMDGYAFLFEEKDFPLLIQNKIAAGDSNFYTINSKQASRIFTGAPVPKGADTVVMQEKVIVKDGNILIKDIDLQKGNNVRPKGSEIKSGALALPKNTSLTPAALGFLAAIGIAEVPVFPAPKVSIIITGNELQKPGNELLPGQVYESSSISLSAVLKECGIVDIDILYAADEAETVQSTLKIALEKSDFILLTGGISVGDYDFVLPATEHCGIEKHFHKIKQKPGKPFYFGTRGDKVIFGLPGNPGSALTCFYEYVLPALAQMMNKKNSIQKIEAILQNAYSKNTGMTHFLKGFYEVGKVTILPAQASFQLSSFAQANCLIVINEETEEVKAGAKVEVHLLPI
ncbi:MAG TPA: gephyrin-like molybdotransferase Glp [Hanamia sp.]|nr:gephyrin-like molybdotransferase Glp [Hanamia sp.]